MSNIHSIVDRYLATWNETDAARRAALIAETFTEAARYVDPLAATEGHAQLAGLIAAVQAKFPGHVFSQRGAPDAHGSFARFSWSLGPAGGPPVGGGTDFAVLDGDRLASVTGFLDALPAAPRPMFITAPDGEQLAFTDTAGTGAPVVFVASASVPGAMWTYQVAALRAAGLRCIAFDRRGHGRSSPATAGFDIDTLAGDLDAVMTALDLHDATLIGHSFGCAELVHYLAKYGSARVARFALIAPTTPMVAQSADNPAGRTPAQSAALHRAWSHDFPGFVADNTAPFFAVETSPALMAWFADLLKQIRVDVAIAVDRCVASVDLRADLRSIDRPALVIHGDRDVSAPVVLGKLTAGALRDARLSVYEGAAHGVFITHLDRVNAELLAFIDGHGR